MEPTDQNQLENPEMPPMTDIILSCCALGRCINHKNLKKCGDCGLVAYCSREHQVEHYKDGHKLICPGRQKGAPLTFQQCLEKASSYYTQQMWVAALPYYAAMLELTERTVGILHIQAANCLDVIAFCYRNQSKYEQAIQCLQRCLIIREIKNDGSDESNKTSANLLGRIAEYYILNDQLELAKQFLIKTQDEIIKSFGEDSFEHGEVLCTLAVCYDKLDEVSEAEKVLVKATSIDKYIHVTLPDELLLASNAYYNLGLIYEKQNKPKESTDSYNKALQMRTIAKLPLEHEDIVCLHQKIEENQTAAVMA